LILFDFTDAGVVVCLDRVKLDPYVEGWEEAKALSRKGRVGPALKALEPLTIWQTPEGLAMHQLARRAIERRRADRIDIHGMERPDIIEYLPVKAFVRDADDWSEVTREWKRYRGAGGDRSFKEWLTREKGAIVHARRLGEVAEQMDDIPGDVQTLLETCREAAVSVSTPLSR
jgi:hypothetical protein